MKVTGLLLLLTAVACMATIGKLFFRCHRINNNNQPRNITVLYQSTSYFTPTPSPGQHICYLPLPPSQGESLYIPGCTGNSLVSIWWTKSRVRTVLDPGWGETTRETTWRSINPSDTLQALYRPVDFFIFCSYRNLGKSRIRHDRACSARTALYASKDIS